MRSCRSQHSAVTRLLTAIMALRAPRSKGTQLTWDRKLKLPTPDNYTVIRVSCHYRLICGLSLSFIGYKPLMSLSDGSQETEGDVGCRPSTSFAPQNRCHFIFAPLPQKNLKSFSPLCHPRPSPEVHSFGRVYYICFFGDFFNILPDSSYLFWYSNVPSSEPLFTRPSSPWAI